MHRSTPSYAFSHGNEHFPFGAAADFTPPYHVIDICFYYFLFRVRESKRHDPYDHILRVPHMVWCLGPPRATLSHIFRFKVKTHQHTHTQKTQKKHKLSRSNKKRPPKQGGTCTVLFPPESYPDQCLRKKLPPTSTPTP